MPTNAYRAELEERKRASTAQLLMKCARLVNEEGIRRQNARLPEGPRLRPSHMALLPHIAHEGTRSTELARAVGVSKQAIGELVSELEEAGFVERIQDPSDGRAKLVRFSRRGRDGLLEGLALLGELEAELEQAIGGKRMRQLHRALLALHDHLEAPPSP